jgi:hypothetical protein
MTRIFALIAAIGIASSLFLGAAYFAADAVLPFMVQHPLLASFLGWVLPFVGGAVAIIAAIRMDRKRRLSREASFKL